MAKTDPFAKALKLIEDTREANSIAYKGEFSVSMLTRYARDTAIDTGRATANWILKGGSPSLNPIKSTDRTSTASPTANKARKASVGIKLNQDIYVSNAVQGEDERGNFTGEGYIIGLENGTGSKQTPLGMFRINNAQAKEVSKRSLRKIFK